LHILDGAILFYKMIGVCDMAIMPFALVVACVIGVLV
jgi:hypothetical protein